MSKLANRITQRIWDDVLDRRGIKHEFEACEPDVKTEIKKAWRAIIDSEIAQVPHE